jgi:hypothetical protein
MRSGIIPCGRTPPSPDGRSRPDSAKPPSCERHPPATARPAGFRLRQLASCRSASGASRRFHRGSIAVPSRLHRGAVVWEHMDQCTRGAFRAARFHITAALPGGRHHGCIGPYAPSCRPAAVPLPSRCCPVPVALFASTAADVGKRLQLGFGSGGQPAMIRAHCRAWASPDAAAAGGAASVAFGIQGAHIGAALAPCAMTWFGSGLLIRSGLRCEGHLVAGTS